MKQIKHISQLTHEFLTLPSDSLVFWDFNNTLMMHRDLLFRLRDYPDNPLVESLKYFMNASKEKNFPLERVFFEAVKHPDSFHLVEKEILPIIQSIKARGIKTGVSTACRTDSIEGIGFIPDLFLQKLEQVNLDFSDSFGAHSDFEFEHDQQKIIVKNGVIFNSKLNKGNVLKAVLQKLTLFPSHVVLIDDLEANLKQASEAFLGTDIKFLPFHYTYVQENFTLGPPEVYQSQIDSILAKGKWLFEDETN